MHDLSTTLVAVATAPGRGAIGCVRLSGPDAQRIARRLLLPRRGSRRPLFGKLLDGEDRPIDHGFVVEFPAERSFTGETAAEIWSHGSPPILAAIVQAAVGHGAVLAGPGEFTYRALRHGRLDLPRAEAVRDLIAATTLQQARAAFSQVEGATARRVAPLRDQLLDLLARGEAAVEFADEQEVHAPEGSLRDGISRALERARELVEEATRGRILREGLRAAICGAPSVGKSSIFNRLLGTERAIVSPMPGTTRDTLEETIDLDGVPLTVIDTAGLRAVADPLEAEGVHRARVAAAESDLTILVLDATRPLGAEVQELLASAPTVPRLVVLNKIDLQAAPLSGAPLDAVGVSALTGAGWIEFRRALQDRVAGAAQTDVPALTNLRHASALELVVAALARAEAAARQGLSDEVLLVEIKEAVDGLGEMLGEVGTEALYERIFSTFCIGK